MIYLLVSYAAEIFRLKFLSYMCTCKLHNDCQHSILCTRNSLLNVMPSIIHHVCLIVNIHLEFYLFNVVLLMPLDCVIE